MNPIIHMFLSYCKSHIYDLHALLAATIAMILMVFIKKPVKRKIDEHVERKSAADPEYAAYRREHRKNWNFVIMLITGAVSLAVYFVIETVSPMLEKRSIQSALICIAFAFTEYAVIDQFIGAKDDFVYPDRQGEEEHRG